MAAGLFTPREVLSDAAWRAVEERLEPFEMDWAAGRRPRIVDHLHADDPSGGRLLVELVLTDLEYRLKAGEFARVEGYLADFPRLREVPGAVEELVAAEFRFRKRREPELEESEVRRRFDGAAEGRTKPRNADRTDRDRKGTPSSDSDGDTFPTVTGYRIVGELGQGGMGVVYEAVEIRLKRTVAIKTLRPGWDVAERARLQREAEAAAALVHPNVVPVHAVFADAGRLYVVSEYVPGGTLAARVAGAPLTSSDAAAVLEPIARAVAYAHSRGIVHRDLKPQNVLLAADGSPKVADFGLAKRIEDDTDPTQTGVISGTPSYMAPEQALGRKDVGPAADVWALGAILYELLTGRPPFHAATSLQTLELVRAQDPVPPRRLVPAVERDLETVCLKCLEKSPESRYSSAIALADDLAKFRRREPVSARPVGRIGLASRWAKRHPTVAALSALLAASLVAGTTLSLLLAARASAFAEATAASERHVKRLLFASDATAAAQAIKSGDVKLASGLLREHESEGRGDFAFVYNHLSRLARVEGGTFDRFTGPVYFACYSPDGKTVAACGKSGEVRFYDATTWKLTGRLRTEQGEINCLAFTPTGDVMASAGDSGDVVAWDLRTGREKWRKRLFDRPVYQVAYGLDGAVLAAGGVDPRVAFLDATNGEILWHVESDPEGTEGIAPTPDGASFIVAGYRGKCLVCDARARDARLRFDLGRRLCSVTVAADGRSAAFGTTGAEVILTRLDGGECHVRVPVGTSRLQLPTGAGTPDGPRGGVACRSVAFDPTRGDLLVGTDAGVVHRVRLSQQDAAGRLAPGEGLAAGTEIVAGQAPRSTVGDLEGGRDQTASELSPRPKGWDAHDGRVNCLAVGPRGEVVSGCRDGAVAAWLPDASPPARLLHFADTGGASHFAWVRTSSTTEPHLAVAAGKHIHVASPEAPDGKVVASHDRDWSSIVASGSRLYAADDGGLVQAWQYGGGELVPIWRRQWPQIAGVKFGEAPSDGRWLPVELAWLEGDRRVSRVSILHTDDGRLSPDSIPRPYAPILAASRDGTAIASTYQSDVELLDPATLQKRAVLYYHSEDIKSLAFSPQGDLATSGGDGRVIVWDVRRTRPFRIWHSAESVVESVRFSPDGKMLLTATRDHPPRLWDIATKRLLLEPGAVPEDVRGGALGKEFAMFSPSGRQIVYGRGGLVAVLSGDPLDAFLIER